MSDQWRVLKRFFVWPVLCLQVGTLVPVIGMTGARSAGLSSAWPFESVLAAFLSFANTFLGTAALCWLGLWFGLAARRQIIGIFYAVGLAQGVPWLASLLVLILGAAGGGPTGRTMALPYAMISWLPEAAVLVFNLAMLTWAGRGLAGRLTAAETGSLGLGRFILPGAREALASFSRLPFVDHMHRFLPALFLRQGGRVVSVPVSHRPRHKGRAHYGVWDRLWVGIVDLAGVSWLRMRMRRTGVAPISPAR